MTARKKIRYAVVGLGWFAQAAILPAFASAGDNSELTTLVSGDPEKARALGQQYDVPVVSYDKYADLIRSGNIDAVYIALPNTMHREYTEMAARAGVHVLCEKPMADSSADAEQMVEVCQRNNIRLMIAYRLHFEEANLEAIRVVRSGEIGEARVFHSVFTQQVEGENIRLERDLGGGPIEDIGIYCINAARYLFRNEPTEVMAYAVGFDNDRFSEVPRTVSVQMLFPGDRLAYFVCGFGEGRVSTYQMVGTQGDLLMKDAYTWRGDITQIVTIDGKSKESTFEQRDQIAPEILYFSDCILQGRDPEPSGIEGLIDVRIIEAIRESYTYHRPVKLGKMPSKRRPSLAQEISRPAIEQPELVNASPPSE
ncbi:MAG: Gfo/Idh/MocA family oxidoreductase [Gemmataceae bacterium]